MRIGIAGAGSMAEVHAAAWRSVGADLAGYCLRSGGADDGLARRCHLRAFTSYTEFLESVDLVDICTPTSLHKSMVLGSLRGDERLKRSLGCLGFRRIPSF